MYIYGCSIKNVKQEWNLKKLKKIYSKIPYKKQTFAIRNNTEICNLLLSKKYAKILKYY